MDDVIVRVLMSECLTLAAEAIRLGELPFAAVVARGDGTIIGRGMDRRKSKNSNILHAEMSALIDAQGRFPVDADDLIVASILEPCIMCTGAIYLNRARAIIYGLSAPAETGMVRVRPPQNPGIRTPRVVGPISASDILPIFENWLKINQDQTAYANYIDSIMQINRVDPMAAVRSRRLQHRVL